MPLRLDISKKLSSRSDRVKSVDFHPSSPWVLSALYNGSVFIWNYEKQSLYKSFEITDVPVRAAKFIGRKSWLIAGSDDLQIRVYNYNTHEKIIAFEAHTDYIRSIAVHPTLPYVISCSDDMLIKLWDWEKGWKNIMTFEGHYHYVMQVVFNPKDSNTFASASMDRTLKVWSLGSSTPNYTLEGHENGVNCVDYYQGGDKPYLVSGADDRLVKIWDYQNKTCVQTLEGHSQNVTTVNFHPELPIIITGSEDGTIRTWHSNTYRLENTLNYGMERVWASGTLRGSNDVVFGYDEGTVVIKIGREEPSVSMDTSGKIIWSRQNEIQTASVKASVEESIKDGERISLSMKELGNCEIFPQLLKHSPNGRFVVVCGDGEYIIYTALAWRNKSFGSGLDFVWAQDSNEYAVRESTSRIKLFKGFKERNESIRTSYSAEGIFGGVLLGIKSNTFLNFYDWETGVCVRRVDAVVNNVYWSDSEHVAIACDDAFYILHFNRAAYQSALDRTGGRIGDEGVEEAFDFINEVPEGAKTGCWVGECFVYSNSLNRLNYVVGGQVATLSHFDWPIYVLGYIARDGRIFFTDKDINVSSFALPSTLIEYQIAILRGDEAAAAEILPKVPSDQLSRVARFLESQGFKELALDISTDQEHKFELAIQLQQLDVAYEIAAQVDQEEKWKILGDAAMGDWKFALAEECLKHAHDIEGLLLMYQAAGNVSGMVSVAEMAKNVGKHNIAFLANFYLTRLEECVDLLESTNRIPEAAFFSQTYLPGAVPEVVSKWRNWLKKENKGVIAKNLADPISHPDFFSDYQDGLGAQAFVASKSGNYPPGNLYHEYKNSLEWNMIQLSKKDQSETNGSSISVKTATSPARNSKEVDETSLSNFSMDVNTTGTRSCNEEEEELDDDEIDRLIE